jgi:hypothetical protein
VVMLTVLGGLAEFERSLIVARTARAGHEHRRKALGSAGRGRSMRINGGKLLHAWTLAMPQPTWPARLAAIGDNLSLAFDRRLTPHHVEGGVP